MRRFDPMFGYTEASLKLHFSENPPKIGDKLLIYGGQYGFHSYYLVRVENGSSGRQKRIIVSKPSPWGGSSFYRSGKNCWAPKSQSRLIPLVREIELLLGSKEEVVLTDDWISNYEKI